jgi:tripartite-type tricarboxylate transporter receptor subunit TctC
MKIDITRRRLSLAAGACLVGTGTASLAEPAFPDHPPRVVVPFAPGGANDVAIRMFGALLERRLGQPLVIDNRPGASGNIAASYAERQAPDGYTLLLGNLGLMVHNPLIYPKPGFDAAGFVPVSCVAETIMVVKVAGTSKFRTLKDLVEYGKSHPGRLNFGSVGTGSPLHLAAELLKRTLGFSAVHVAYSGGGPMTTALMGEEVDFVVDPLVNVGTRVRGLAVLDARRRDAFPGVPTIEEAGYPAVNANSWIALFAPKGTPDAVVKRLAAEAAVVARDPQLRERMQKAGLEPCEGGAGPLRQRIAASRQLWEPLIKQLKIQVD